MDLVDYAVLTIFIFLFYWVFRKESYGMTLTLSGGIGLSVGLFGQPGWGWAAIGLAITLSFVSILFKSPLLLGYGAECRKRGTSPSLVWYFILSTLRNSVVIFIVAFVVFFLVRKMPR